MLVRMKQLYTFILFVSMAAAVGSVQAQVRNSSATLSSQSREFAFQDNGIIDSRSDVKLFPNPAVEYLIVEIKSQELSNVSFELNNIIGNTFQMRSEPLGDNRYKIYVKDLRPGYYFLTLKDDNSTYKHTYRFLKK